LIIAAVLGVIGLLIVPETFEPVLHKREAEGLRHETKNWALHAKMDEEPLHARVLFEKYFSKPLVMLVQEPIVNPAHKSPKTMQRLTASSFWP
jgi:hypothetical protein